MADRVVLGVTVGICRVLVRVNDGVNCGAGYGYAPKGTGVDDLVTVKVLLGVNVLLRVTVEVNVRERVGDR